jgi:quinol monooxygenase YgiN
MIIAITIMNVFPEKQKEVLQTLLSLIEPPAKEKGCLSYGIFCDIEDKNVFNLISEWETRKHLEHHLRSDRFSVLLGTKSLLCEPLNIQIFTISGSEGTETVNSARKKRTIPQEKKKPIFSIFMRKQGSCSLTKITTERQNHE